MRWVYYSAHYNIKYVFARGLLQIVAPIKSYMIVWWKTVGSVWSGLCGLHKNGLHSLPCYFLVDGLVHCPCASQREWRQTQTVNSDVTCRLHPPRSGCCSLSVIYIVLTPEATHTLFQTPTQVKPKLFMKGNFPDTHWIDFRFSRLLFSFHLWR